MKRIITFLILVWLIGFVSCDTLTHYTVRVYVDRNPTLTIVNQTGYPVAVTTPVSSNINHGSRTHFQPTETNRNIDVTYRIGQMSFTEQVSIENQDVTVTLTKRPPTITVLNQTGYKVNLTDPERSNMGIGESVNFLAPGLNRSIDVTYTIGEMRYVERVNMENRDVTVTLTKRPPRLTVANNVGATINTIWLRLPGDPAWVGGNIVIRGGIVNLTAAEGAQAGDISGSIVNRDTMEIRMENVPLRGERFDVRVDDVQGNTYVRSNVQIINDMTLTFTTNDRR